MHLSQMKHVILLTVLLLITLPTQTPAASPGSLTVFHQFAGNPDGGNRWRYASAEVDRLTAAGRHELDPAVRKQLYGRAQQLLAEDVQIVPLWHEDNVVLSARDLAGYAITPNARFSGLTSVVKHRP